MQRRFATLDVFTDRRFAGNPLAVVLDADGLDTAAMQAIAREFNHPETVFVLPPQAPAHRARLRIFTPARELPFAGHPTVGTAALLALQSATPVGGELVLEEGIGPVRCTLERRSDAGAPCAVRHSAAARGTGSSGRRTRDRGRTVASRPPTSASARSGRRAGRPATPSRSCRSRARRHGARPTRDRASRLHSAPMGQGRRSSSAARPPSPRPPFPRPHVRADDGHRGGPGDRLGRRGVRGPARPLRRPAGRRALRR